MVSNSLWRLCREQWVPLQGIGWHTLCNRNRERKR